MRIIVTENLPPREQNGHWVEALHGPKWFSFVLSFLGISPVTWISWSMYEEENVYIIGDVCYCSSKMYQEIKNQLPLKHLMDDACFRKAENPVQYRPVAPYGLINPYMGVWI